MYRWAISLASFVILAMDGLTFAQMAPNHKMGPEMSMPATDDRQAVAVSESTRVFVLAEMRGMLASIQGVTEAIARRDWQAAIDAAGKTGLKAFEGMPKPIMMELPEDFRMMGRETHMAFDEVAKAAIATADPSAVSAKLADALQFCVACHQTYRFETRR
jgi:cytochrome c556